MKLLSALTISATALLMSAPATALERKYAIFGFDEIRIIGGVNVNIVTGKGPSARAEADSREILDRVLLDRSGRALVVSLRKKNIDTGHSDHDSEVVTVNLTTHGVKNIIHQGSGRVNLDSLDGRTPRARLGGFGNLQIDHVDADRLDIAMTGGGQMTLAGEARNARIELQGASVLDSPGLSVATLELAQRGPASSHVTATRDAKITNFGNGSITIDGRPNCQIRSAGSAQIICDPER